MPSVGIDISDRMLRYLELVQKNDRIEVGRFGDRAIPEGIIAEGKIADISKMRAIIRTIAENEGIRFAHVSLPEQHGYIAKMLLPFMRKRYIRESLELQIEDTIPITPASAVFDYEIAPCATHMPDTRHLDISISAMPREIIQEYAAIFEDTAITPLSFEFEAQAMARAVLPENCDTIMLVDIGMSRTGIFIQSHGLIRYTTTIPFGGLALTKLLAERFHVSIDEARKLKESHGLIQAADNTDIALTLIPAVSLLQDEIRKYCQYWETHQENERIEHSSVERIILCGGEGNMPGLPDYLSRGLILPIELANPWLKITSFDAYIPPITKSHALQYATAIGLALRES